MHPREYNTRRGWTTRFDGGTEFANPFVMNADDGADEDATGGGENDETPPENDETPPENDDENKDGENKKPKPSDAEAKLLKDAMKHKKAAQKASADLAAATAALEAYRGVDPVKVAALLEAEANAEREAAEKRGEYDRILAQVKEQHTAQVTELQNTISAKDNSLAAAMAQIDDLTVGADFGNSTFLSEKTILSPKKARVLYGAHFDRVDGVTVAYDKPRGAANRTPLVDANGDNLSFEAALEKIITADEDFERIAKSKLKPGSGSQGAQHKAEAETEKKEVTGSSRIAVGLAKLGQPKK